MGYRRRRSRAWLLFCTVLAMASFTRAAEEKADRRRARPTRRDPARSVGNLPHLCQ